MNFPKQFIGASHEYADYDRQVPAPYLRRRFSLKQKPESAEILISGLGFYRLFVNGKEITIKSVADAMANDIGYVPEDRLTQGLFMERSIQDNTIASSIRRYMKGGRLDEQAMEDVTRHWIDEIGIVAPSPKPAVRTLSGGNAQKVVIAKWLNTEPKLFILDGPTVGVDVGAKAEIHAILHNLAQKGIGIIVISDDLPELVQNCNKIVVMRDGKVAAAIDNNIDEISLSNLLIGANEEEVEQK